MIPYRRIKRGIVLLAGTILGFWCAQLLARTLPYVPNAFGDLRSICGQGGSNCDPGGSPGMDWSVSALGDSSLLDVTITGTTASGTIDIALNGSGDEANGMVMVYLQQANTIDTQLTYCLTTDTGPAGTHMVGAFVADDATLLSDIHLLGHYPSVLYHRFKTYVGEAEENVVSGTPNYGVGSCGGLTYDGTDICPFDSSSGSSYDAIGNCLTDTPNDGMGNYTLGFAFTGADPGTITHIVISYTQSATITISGSPPTPPTLAKWNPGHYVKASGQHCSDDQDGYFTGVEQNIDKMSLSTQFKGTYVIFPWGALETDDGVYDWTRVYQIINYLLAKGSNYKLILAVEHKCYGGNTSVNWIAPANLESEVEPHSGATAGIVPLWREDGWSVPYIADQYIAFVQALAAEFDDNPVVEQISFAPEYCSGGTTAPDYNQANYVTQLTRIDDAAAAAFSHTIIAPGLNCGLGDGANILEDIYDNGHGRAGPDAHQVEGYNLFIGTSPAVRDYRGLIPHRVIVSAPNLGGVNDMLPLSYIQGVLETGGVTHAAWYMSGSATGGTAADIAAYLDANGNFLATDCPTQVTAIYGGCETTSGGPPGVPSETPDYPYDNATGQVLNQTTDAIAATALNTTNYICGHTYNVAAGTEADNVTTNLDDLCPPTNPIVIKGAANWGTIATGNWTTQSGSSGIYVTGIWFQGGTVTCRGDRDRIIGNRFSGTTGSPAIHVTDVVGNDFGCEIAYNEIGNSNGVCLGTAEFKQAIKQNVPGTGQFVNVHKSLWIHHNHIDGWHSACSQGDAIELGESGTYDWTNDEASPVGHYVEDNLIEDFTAGNGEPLDDKGGCGQVIRRNTVRTSDGHKIQNRQGCNNIFEGNYMANGSHIMVNGADNQVYCNVVTTGEIRVQAGNQPTGFLGNGYGAALRTIVAKNSAGSLDIGHQYNAGHTYPADQTLVEQHSGGIQCNNETNTDGACGDPANPTSTRLCTTATELDVSDVGMQGLLNAPAAYRTGRGL